MKIKVYDTLSGVKRDFIPINGDEVRMYVCGPTVYDVPHIGNIRAAVVYDIVYRVLRKAFTRVVYVRNITDIDDKIINASLTQGVEYSEIALRYEKIFREHLKLMNCLPPSFEPRATENIEQMISIIRSLVESGNAYRAGGSVYFDVSSFKDYGALSKKKIDELVYGVRIDGDENKRHPGDFVLWKHDDEVYWPSPWGNGRPGWHIECSAMILTTLGADFDIHGGGADLKFPHHENEIAQSVCANPGSKFARYWIHNGFLTVNGEKMSKSLGNIINVDTLIKNGVTPNTIRFILISTHYSKPMDWCPKIVQEAVNSLMKFKIVLIDNNALSKTTEDDCDGYMEKFFISMSDDFNTPAAIALLYELRDKIHLGDHSKAQQYAVLLNTLLLFLGIDLQASQSVISEDFITSQIQERVAFRQQRNFVEADKIRDTLAQKGVLLRDLKDGTTDWIML
ncbi:cysteine--tRNA ligase [Neorickettsia helminthoeca str. Oregon]|uniref:Cysteine--tRNA ligase n=1 Tax=Neorickettsia helminthoeca str. Oregon TaxID=1286528 RepID=X5HJK4_9RICK|nr:cysteine--tRNA ligase [Neorickettsia helminthoeca]AHX11274.1 cysteine--tRNA ligase [Neorickettsia helminthoeca str. Oregon]